jgi:hypothetical protein
VFRFISGSPRDSGRGWWRGVVRRWRPCERDTNTKSGNKRHRTGDDRAFANLSVVQKVLGIEFVEGDVQLSARLVIVFLVVFIFIFVLICVIPVTVSVFVIERIIVGGNSKRRSFILVVLFVFIGVYGVSRRVTERWNVVKILGTVEVYLRDIPVIGVTELFGFRFGARRVINGVRVTSLAHDLFQIRVADGCHSFSTFHQLYRCGSSARAGVPEDGEKRVGCHIQIITLKMLK